MPDCSWFRIWNTDGCRYSCDINSGAFLFPLVSFVSSFFLINNLLLLNQYPDVKADASVGRNTLPIVFGLNKSNFVDTIFFMAAYLLILIYIAKGYIPNQSIIAVIPIVFSLFALFGMNKHGAGIGDFPQYLGIFSSWIYPTTSVMFYCLTLKLPHLSGKMVLLG